MAVSGIAAARKSPTFDEPYHLASAAVALRDRDFRVDPEDPPGWKYLAALPSLGLPFHVDLAADDWQALPNDLFAGRDWSSAALYGPSSDVAVTDAMVQRARWVMLMIAGALGAAIAVWAYRMAGGIAAVVATAVYCCNPTLLAHASAIKSDVPFSLLLFLLVAQLVAYLHRRTAWRVGGLGLITGLGLLVKFSALLFPPILSLAILIHAIATYRGKGRSLALRRSPIVAIDLAAIGAVAAAILWAGYGFRFDATNDGVSLNVDRVIRTIGEREQNRPGAAVSAALPLGVRAMSFAYTHHLAPEGWIVGELFIDQATYGWFHYFCGTVEHSGHWYYFPFTILVKTPCGLLILWMCAAAGAVARCPRWNFAGATAIAMGTAVLIYSAALLQSNLNEGVRHALPLYPFACMGSGVVAAAWWRNAAARRTVVTLLIVAAAETAAAFPDFLAYFNVAAGGEREGLALLGDSNLDWGQDLPALAAWQRDHPDRTLYLAYFGAVEPAHFGVTYQLLPGGYGAAPMASPALPEPGVLAISATVLQGIYATPDFDTAATYAPFRGRPPMAVLGGTIYLYDWPGRRDGN